MNIYEDVLSGDKHWEGSVEPVPEFQYETHTFHPDYVYLDYTEQKGKPALLRLTLVLTRPEQLTGFKTLLTQKGMNWTDVQAAAYLPESSCRLVFEASRSVLILQKKVFEDLESLTTSQLFAYTNARQETVFNQLSTSYQFYKAELGPDLKLQSMLK